MTGDIVHPHRLDALSDKHFGRQLNNGLTLHTHLLTGTAAKVDKKTKKTKIVFSFLPMNFPEELSDSAYFRINMLYFRYLKKDQNHIFTSHYQILYLRQLALHTTSSRLKGASEKTRPRTKEFHQAIHPRPTLSPLFRPVYRHRLRRAVKRHPERRYTAKKEYEKSGNGSGRITRTANRRRDIRHLLSDRQVWPETRRERIPAGLRRPGTTGFARACRPSPATAEGLETAVVTPRGEVRRRRVRRTAHATAGRRG